jgi:putative hemolysin
MLSDRVFSVRIFQSGLTILKDPIRKARMPPTSDPQFHTRLARDAADLAAAQALRYRVFVQEMGSDGPGVDHLRGLETDPFDEHFDHLLLIDAAAGDRVVGVYRLANAAQARAAGQFYSVSEYDLTPLLSSDRRLLELGRSCLDPAYRGGAAMFHLWSALADHVADQRIEVLFGTASFAGTDVTRIAPALSLLHHAHLAPPALRVRARTYQPMDLIPADRIDRRAAMLAVPALIKAYLRLGGVVGDGAHVDHAFNTIDVCLIMDTARLNARQASIYSKGPER